MWEGWGGGGGCAVILLTRQQRYSTEVHVNEFNFLNNRNESSTESSYQAPPAQTSQPAPESQNQDQPDDLPF